MNSSTATRTARAGTITTKSLRDREWLQRHGGFIFMILLVLYALLFRPFWKPMILGFLFASASGPLQARLNRALHSRRKPVAYGILAVITLSTVGLLVLIGVQIYYTLFQAFDNGDVVGAWSKTLIGARDKILGWLQEQDILTSVDLNKQIGRATGAAVTYIRDLALIGTSDFLAATPEILLNFFVFMMAFAAFLLMGSRTFITTANVLGIEGNHEQQFRRFEKICALSLGSVLLTGLLQATLVTIGARVCSLGNYFLIFAATFILSMIPFAGGGLLPFVLAVISIIQGDAASGTILLVTAGVAVVSENFLKAFLFSKAAATNPLISMISLIGGVTLMGFAGLFIAPVIEQLVMAEFHRRREAQSAGP